LNREPQNKNLGRFPSPLTKTIIVDWYDGPTSGFFQEVEPVEDWAFRLISWSKSRRVRLFALARLPVGSFAKALDILERYSTPRWPVWVISSNVDGVSNATIDQLILSGESPTQVTAVDGDNNVIATADLSESDANRALGDASRIDEHGFMEPAEVSYWFSLLGIKDKLES